MASSANRKQIELPADLHAALMRYGTSQHMGGARIAAVAVWEYLKREAATELTGPWSNGDRVYAPADQGGLVSAATRRLQEYRHIADVRRLAAQTLNEREGRLSAALSAAYVALDATQSNARRLVAELLDLQRRSAEAMVVSGTANALGVWRYPPTKPE